MSNNIKYYTKRKITVNEDFEITTVPETLLPKPDFISKNKNYIFSPRIQQSLKKVQPFKILAKKQSKNIANKQRRRQIKLTQRGGGQITISIKAFKFPQTVMIFDHEFLSAFYPALYHPLHLAC